MNYVVAYQLLHRVACVKHGERILVHSAAGGVGMALLQLGKLAGLEIYGTASKSKHHFLTELGGIPIDYKTENFAKRIFDFTKEGVNVVFDPIGGTHLWKSYQTLSRNGRLVVYGAHTLADGNTFDLISGLILSSFLKLMPRKRNVITYSITRPKYSTPQLCREDLTKLFDMLKHGKIQPIIAQQIPLIEAPHAHRLLEKNAGIGKFILVCNSH